MKISRGWEKAFTSIKALPNKNYEEQDTGLG